MCNTTVEELRAFCVQHPHSQFVVLHRCMDLHDVDEMYSDSDDPCECWCSPLTLSVEHIFAAPRHMLQIELNEFYQVH